MALKESFINPGTVPFSFIDLTNDAIVDLNVLKADGEADLRTLLRLSIKSVGGT